VAQVQLHKTTENFEKMERQLKVKEDEAKKREDELRDLVSKVRKLEMEDDLERTFEIRVSNSHPFHTDPDLDPGDQIFGDKDPVPILGLKYLRIRIQGSTFFLQKLIFYVKK